MEETREQGNWRIPARAVLFFLRCSLQVRPAGSRVRHEAKKGNDQKRQARYWLD
jgi:hypothetical protein